MFNFLADIAIKIGTFCADLAEYHKVRREAWLDRGRYWSDIAKWLRMRCVKSFTDIRAERETAK